MGAYLKLDYSCSYNRGMRKALIYIGRNYGKHKHKNECTDYEYYNSGVEYVAKKFGRFRKNAIRYMVYPKKIKESNNKRWYFNKQIYVKAYSVIVDCLLKSKGDDRAEVLRLLTDLFIESKIIDPQAERVCSNALIFWQKKMLSVNCIHQNNATAIEANTILRDIEKSDKRIPRR